MSNEFDIAIVGMAGRFPGARNVDEFWYIGTPVAAGNPHEVEPPIGSIPAEAVAPAVGLRVEQVARVWRDIASKRRATNYLHCPPLLVEPVLAHDQIRAD